MADFDQFTSAEPPQQEEDPAAAFLAREQDELAQLEGDGIGAGGDASGADPYGRTAPPADIGGEAGGDDMFEGQNTSTEPNLDSNPYSSAADADAGFDFDPLADSASTDPAATSTVFDTFGEPVASEQPSDPYSSIKQVDKQRTEPEKIRLWREEQKERLARKDEESEVKKTEWREIASKELDDWYKHKNEQLEKAKKNTRDAEAAFIRERDESLPGAEWERVCRLCEFNPKTTRTSKDVSRMRSILLQLKQDKHGVTRS